MCNLYRLTSHVEAMRRLFAVDLSSSLPAVRLALDYKQRSGASTADPVQSLRPAVAA
ncbi:MAG: hypothetical protein ACRYG4_17435 [Janthinobacterium lividum]